MPVSANAQRAGHSGTGSRIRGIIARSALPGPELRADSETKISGYAELIGRLVREIDETMLSRRFALFAGDDPVAFMIVSNRRLLELEIDGRKVEPGADTDPSPETFARIHAQALKTLSARLGPVTLRVIGRAPQALASDTSCMAHHLAAFSDTTCLVNRLETFLERVHPVSHGWILGITDNEAKRHDPDREVFQRLTVLAQHVGSRGGPRERYGHANWSGPLCTAFSISDEVQALVVSEGNDWLVAALPERKVSSAMAQWTSIYGRTRADSEAAG